MSYTKDTMKNLIAIVFSILALGASAYAIESRIAPTQFGATANPSSNALYEQALASPLGTADASMFVTSGADVQGNLLPVGSYQCLSVDTGQPNFEAVCGNVAASATSGLTLTITLRGLSTQTATTSVPSQIFTHRRGADVRITDFPSLTILNNELSGVQNIPFLLNYDPSVLITGSSASTTIATKYYVDNVVASGAPNATTLVKGIVQLATSLQAASSTSLGSTGASLVLQASSATDTPNTATRGSRVLMSSIAGFLNQAWIDFTQAFTFSGGVTINTNPLTVNSSAVFNGTATFNAPPVGIDWQLVVATTTTNSTQKILQATTTTSYKRYLIYINTYGNASADSPSLYFNNDYGANYGVRQYNNLTTTQATQGSGLTTGIPFYGNLSTTSPMYAIVNVYGPSTTRKWAIFTATENSSGAALPQDAQGDVIWNNTAGPITNFELFNGGGNGFLASSTMTVYGSNSGN